MLLQAIVKKYFMYILTTLDSEINVAPGTFGKNSVALKIGIPHTIK